MNRFEDSENVFTNVLNSINTSSHNTNCLNKHGSKEQSTNILNNPVKELNKPCAAKEGTPEKIVSSKGMIFTDTKPTINNCLTTETPLIKRTVQPNSSVKPINKSTPTLNRQVSTQKTGKDVLSNNSRQKSNYTPKTTTRIASKVSQSHDDNVCKKLNMSTPLRTSKAAFTPRSSSITTTSIKKPPPLSSEQELLQSSVQDRVHTANEIERIKKERKRQSLLLNAEIFKKGKEREKQLIQQQKEKESLELENRRYDALARENKLKQEAAAKRQSLMSRGQVYRKQKKIMETIHEQTQQEELNILEIRKSFREDDYQVKLSQIAEDHEYLDYKTQQYIHYKQVEKQQLEEESQRQDEEYQQRAKDWYALEKYKEEIHKKSRESLLSRSQEFKRIKAYDKEQAEFRSEQEELDRILKEQDYLDIQAYHQQLREKARQSLLYRAKQCKSHQQYTQAQLEIQREQEEKDRLLVEEDRQVISMKQQRARELARQSLLTRHEIQKQYKLRISDEKEQQKLLEDQEKYETILYDKQRMLQHETVQKELKRHSMVLHMMNQKKQYEHDIKKHNAFLIQLHEEYEEHMFEFHQKELEEKERQEQHRQSILYRLESWKQQRLAEDMLSMKRQLYKEEERELLRLDQEALEYAQHLEQEEKKKIYLDTKLKL